MQQPRVVLFFGKSVVASLAGSLPVDHSLAPGSCALLAKGHWSEAVLITLGSQASVKGSFPVGHLKADLYFVLFLFCSTRG